MPEPMTLVGKEQNATDSGETRKIEEHAVNLRLMSIKRECNVLRQPRSHLVNY